MFRQSSSSFVKPSGSRPIGEFSNAPNTSPSGTSSSSSDDSKLSKSFLMRGTSFVGGFSQSFTLPKRTTSEPAAGVDTDSSVRRNSEVTQRLPSPSIAEPIEVDKNLVSMIKSWAFEGSFKQPDCLNPNFKPKIQKEEPEAKRSESVVIDEKKSFNELFDSLFSSSAIEETKEASPTIEESQSDVASPPRTPPSTTTSSTGTGNDLKGTPPKGGIKSLFFGKKYKPTTTATTSNITVVKETPKQQQLNPYKITHVPLKDEQFDKTGFKLELSDFQIMENFKDVSRYNRKKDIDEQKRMRSQLMESNKNSNSNEDDSVLERESDFSNYSSPSDSPIVEKSTEELRKKKKFIEKEIMETEIGYVRNLVHLFEYYLLPIRKVGILSKETYQVVFKNINMILAINMQLLKEFEKVYYASNPKDSLASVFSSRIPAIKLYVGYVNTYPSAIKCLNETLSKDNVFDSWEKSQRNNEVNGVKIFPLRSYIALPLQRITKYFLLFNDLLGTLEGDEYYSLSAVIDELKALSTYCVEKKNESDNLETLLEFQKKLKLKELVRGDRTFLREGIASADNGETIVELYLFSDLLVYVMSNDTKRVIKEVPLKAGNLIELTKVSSTTVMLSFQNEKSYITFDSEEDQATWSSAINEQLNSSITKARIRRRGNSSTPLEEKIIFAGYLTKSKGLSKKSRFHTLSSMGGVKYYDKPNGDMKGSYQIKGSKIFKKSPTTFLLTANDGKSFYYSTENDSIASTWINRFIGLGAILMKQ